MAEAKTKKAPTLNESISKIEDSIVEAKSEGDTKRVKILEATLKALLRKRDEKKNRS